MTRDLQTPSHKNRKNGRFSKTMAVVRRPLAGPLFFGLVFGAIPLGIVFGCLNEGILSSASLLGFVAMLSPVAVLVTVIAAVSGTNTRWTTLLYRAFLASLAVWIPIPGVVCAVLAWHWGREISMLKDFVALSYFILMWATFLTVPSWLCAFGYIHFQQRRAASKSS
jgi:hypothetical protein